MDTPKTLLEAVKYFAHFDHCRAFMMDLRWPDGKVACPRCGSEHIVYLEKARVWKCYAKHPQPTFSLKTGTIFEDSPLGLDKWIAAVWLIVNCKNDLRSYDGLANTYAHQVINHAVKYVDGQIHVNGLENFWSLLKRGIHGTYVSVEPFHLFRYLDEQAFRFNNRIEMNDFDRFRLALSQIVGKRLTYAEVSGKTHEPSSAN